ncbi:MAG: hypothetical protein KC646_17695 [Candidatus Cloacimonetes bacterium]|nr:hypothetical protein [Candidatus Cloacimonadota bacterium]
MYYFLILFSIFNFTHASSKVPEKIVDPISFKSPKLSDLSNDAYLYQAMINTLSEAHEHIYSDDPDKVEAYLKSIRNFTKANYTSLAVFHLCRFHIHDKRNEPLKAYNQGIAILNSPLFNYMNPSDIEYFLFRLNTISDKNKYYLPSKYKFPLEEWFILSNFELLQISRVFTRQKLKILDLNQAKALAKYTKETPYNYLLLSYLQINKKEKVKISRHARSKHSSRWKRRNRKRKVNPHAKTINLAKTAIKYSFSKFQKSFIYHHLLFLYKLINDDNKVFETLMKIEQNHPTSDAYSLLADYYRDKKNWKKMHYYNNKLIDLDPKQNRVSGPEPVISPIR